ncbi:dihydrofolate reductase [Camelimonas fluminis]|uniref:D-2-hydroxyacid dehydrogenase n=1 Tax=Camelimonas fluminis TaxID=1576911 RepID=A0ABV7UE01_9HYPH|nr:D-2-hydroxyacid dehydrogenase [Camelimonas fluminis]GHE51720.1 dihydrofolate reductase [Camelimonas fluminis]
MRIAVCSPILLDDMLTLMAATPGIEAWACEPGDLPAATREADAIVLGSFHYGPELGAALAAPQARTRWLQLLTAGYETLDMHGVPARCLVSNAGDVWSPSVAEHVFSLMLGLARCARQCAADQQAGRWNAPVRHQVRSLAGARLLIIGMGGIGRETAVRARAFGMSVAGVNRSGRPVAEADVMYPVGRLHAALAEADVIVVAAPSTPETRSMIGREQLAVCKPDALLINVARGDLVDSDALLEALRAGKIGGAGLDVTDPEPLPQGHPLWAEPNVIVTPHLGGAASPAYMTRLARHVAENAARFAAGETPFAVVRVQPG